MIALIEDQIINSFASCTLEDEDIARIISTLEPKHFSIFDSGERFEKLVQLYSEGELNQYNVKKHIEYIDADLYVLYGDELTQAIFDVKNDYKRRTIKEFIISTNDKINEDSKNVDSNKVINELTAKLQELLLESDSKTYTYSEEMQKEIARFYSANPKELQGVNTGDAKLNFLLQGYQRKDLIIIGARPSMGKTAFVLFNIIEMALKGIPVGFFSLEMSKEQIMTRIFAYLANKDSMKIRSGDLPESEKIESINKVMDVGNLPIYINDEPALTNEKMQGIATMWKSKYDIQAVFVDYLGLMSTSQNFQNRTNEIGFISSRLKVMAKKIDVPVISLSQLSRANEKRQEKKPILSDLRDSGNIEQDADVVIFLHRDDYHEGKKDIVSELQVIIAKNRNGVTGEVTKKYDKATGRMYAIMANDEFIQGAENFQEQNDLPSYNEKDVMPF